MYVCTNLHKWLDAVHCLISSNVFFRNIAELGCLVLRTTLHLRVASACILRCIIGTSACILSCIVSTPACISQLHPLVIVSTRVEHLNSD